MEVQDDASNPARIDDLTLERMAAFAIDFAERSEFSTTPKLEFRNEECFASRVLSQIFAKKE
jgi:hypothetical protein